MPFKWLPTNSRNTLMDKFAIPIRILCSWLLRLCSNRFTDVFSSLFLKFITITHIYDASRFIGFIHAGELVHFFVARPCRGFLFLAAFFIKWLANARSIPRGFAADAARQTRSFILGCCEGDAEEKRRRDMNSGRGRGREGEKIQKNKNHRNILTNFLSFFMLLFRFAVISAIRNVNGPTSTWWWWNNDGIILGYLRNNMLCWWSVQILGRYQCWLHSFANERPCIIDDISRVDSGGHCIASAAIWLERSGVFGAHPATKVYGFTRYRISGMHLPEYYSSFYGRIYLLSTHSSYIQMFRSRFYFHLKRNIQL